MNPAGSMSLTGLANTERGEGSKDREVEGQGDVDAKDAFTSLQYDVQISHGSR